MAVSKCPCLTFGAAMPCLDAKISLVPKHQLIESLQPSWPPQHTNKQTKPQGHKDTYAETTDIWAVFLKHVREGTGICCLIVQSVLPRGTEHAKWQIKRGKTSKKVTSIASLKVSPLSNRFPTNSCVTGKFSGSLVHLLIESGLHPFRNWEP